MRIAAQALRHEVDKSADLPARASPFDMQETHWRGLRFECRENRLEFAVLYLLSCLIGQQLRQSHAIECRQNGSRSQVDDHSRLDSNRHSRTVAIEHPLQRMRDARERHTLMIDQIFWMTRLAMRREIRRRGVGPTPHKPQRNSEYR